MTDPGHPDTAALRRYATAAERVARLARNYATALENCPCHGAYYAPTCDVAWHATRLWTAEQDLAASRVDAS